ncbi:MAG: ABC transporter permease [Chitinophagales bacterium]
MLKNYLLLAVKNFRKQKLFSLINLLGLTVGITCCLMIFIFILNEYSYDRFHKNANNIYRIMRVGNFDGVRRNVAWVSPPYSTALLNDYPDAVQKVIRVQPDNDLITYKNASFNEKNIYLADSNFFDFFSFRLLRGDPKTVLNDPLSIVMTVSAAKKYFGNEDPIGKVVDFNKEMKLKVSGIAEDVPVNSHLQFDMVIPNGHWHSAPWFSQWPNNGLFVYVQLHPGVKPEQLTRLFPAFMDKYLGKFYKENGFKMDLTMDQLKNIYFEGETPFDKVKHGSKKMVYIFMSIALLILVIACINFMNLVTARANDRSKEVGLRKVMGAVRRQLALQFLFESVLLATVAAVLGLLLLQLIMPAYTSFLGYRLPSFWSNLWVYIFLAGIILVVGLFAGSYPAILLSSFSPIESLKGKLKVGKHGAFFRMVLVVFQFGISVLLIVSVTIVMNQMHYVHTTDLGFTKDQCMIVRLDNNAIWNKKVEFKNQLQADPAVNNVSLMTGEPGGFHDGYGFEVEGKPGEKLMFNTEFADFEYAKTLGLKIIAGRDFSPQFISDSTKAVIINRTAAKALGYTPEQSIGKSIRNIATDSLPRTIVGVVEDYHFTSLKQNIGPLVISTKKDDRRLALIRLNATHMKETIERFRKIYSSVAPDYPFEYEFLDEKFGQLYKSEINQETLLSVFSGIAICIACLGLFGLASYTAVKRTKEIGVRKVLGSSVENIVFLLSRDLLKPVLLGTLIAVPAGWLIMQKWLQGFAYRVDMHWWLFLIATMIAVLIALFTVSIQAIKAAVANPVKSLRTE